jgi:glycosyltransferase involved in cell wall biosynthesis
VTALAARQRTPGVERRPRRDPTIEVVVPVYNEARVLEWSIRRLYAFLATSMPFAWTIVVADNASTDETWVQAERLSAELDRVRALHLDQKGRGRALRAAWMQSEADVLCYTDVDLSTDLRALLPLIAGLVSGHSDVAIGTRLAPGSRIVRSREREAISRTYNGLLHLVLRARFSDAQCGFKAISAIAARQLLPKVKDHGWFFDTELLVAAQRHGFRIHEVAVDWVEDPDSRVEIVPTAVGDLRGVGRLLMQPQLARFLLIGVSSTLAYALLYLLLRGWVPPGGANALALACTAIANTQANRRYTFGVRGRHRLLAQHAAGAVVFVLTLALTDGALRLVQAIDPRPARAIEMIVLVLAGAAATACRYVALRAWVFARSRNRPQTLQRAAPAD